MNIPIEIVAAVLTVVLGVVITVISNNTKAVNKLNITTAELSMKLKKDEERHDEAKECIKKHEELLSDHERRLLKHGI